jgi:predicted metal-binding protein
MKQTIIIGIFLIINSCASNKIVNYAVSIDKNTIKTDTIVVEKKKKWKCSEDCQYIEITK